MIDKFLPGWRVTMLVLAVFVGAYNWPVVVDWLVWLVP